MSMNVVERIEKAINEEWESVKENKLYQLVRAGQLSRSVYEMLMVQVYHYTKYNSVNQAAAAYATDSEKVGLLRFMYKHALEELGHENMVIRDLKSIGADLDTLLTIKPLPATEALIGYLYSVALREGGVARLGYSLWAEQCYDQIGIILDAFRTDLGLTDENMTFFVAHSVIDEKHADEVREAIAKWVVTEEQVQSVIQVARTTLYLTGKLMESVVEHCSK